MTRPRIKKIFFILAAVISASLILIYSLSRAENNTAKLDVPKVQYTSQGLRDPFQSPFETARPAAPVEIQGDAADLSRFQVQGMVWGAKSPQAIINNVVVKVGDTIEGVEITDIQKEGVFVRYGGRQYILKPSLPLDRR